MRDVVEDVRPLYGVLLHAWGALAGDSELALRLPAALFGVAMVPAIAWLAARWLGRETAPWAAWLAALSPFLVWYSQEARNYTLMMLLGCVASALLLGMRERISTAGAARWAGTAAAGILSNFAFGLLAPLHLKWWLARPSGRRPGLLLACGVGLLLVLSPWIATALGTWDFGRLEPGRETQVEETPLRGANTFHPAALPFTAHVFAVGYTVGPPLRELRADPAGAVRAHAGEVALAALVFVPLGLAGIAAVARRRRVLDLVLWLAVPTALVSYFALQNFKVFHPRYLAVCAPAVLLLLAAGLADLRRPARTLALIAVGALWALALGRWWFDPRYGKEDMRAAARVIAAEALPGEQVVAANSEDLLGYYLRDRLPIKPLWLGWAADPPTLAARLDERLANATGTWVVASRTEDLDPRGTFARMMDERHPEAERYAFSGVRVWHVTGPGGAPGR